MVLIILLKKNGDIDNIEIKPTKKTVESFIDENKMINYIKNKFENKGEKSSLGIHKRVNFQDSELCYIGFTKGKDNNNHDTDFYEDIIVIRNSLQTKNYFENIRDLKSDDYHNFINLEGNKNNNFDDEEEIDEEEIDDEEIDVGEEDLDLHDKEVYSEFSSCSELTEIDLYKNTLEEEEEEEELQNEEENLDDEILNFDEIDTSELNIEEYNYPEEVLKIINEEENNFNIYKMKDYDISKLNLNDINHI